MPVYSGSGPASTVVGEFSVFLGLAFRCLALRLQPYPPACTYASLTMKYFWYATIDGLLPVCRLGSRPALDIKRRAHEPRYSHHCYVRADDRHASAIGPILRIDQLPAGSYEFTGCGYGLGAVSVCQLPHVTGSELSSRGRSSRYRLESSLPT